ncbi:tektin A1 [Strongylocentrotus purpuratus]|uniref:Tektin n=1 Tax=Strongylocentrotus purpuratus TaxID=7668 RepID=Q9U0E3_STRPU|nr:tektin A1 [Strongylocentrotus purpuratus]8SNB_8D Chain 8D, Tektin A1 [Strongylocentrotus purpuratus]8SNB_8E Chain 8E, Tektin A1 [Strongylocentrotus purpuratus]8SNB_8F Chain 8F, Tektin A1 [Strongylocentrotus purpuratus]8SNB_8G Chain 8G, Tektin A1 [Strongylocentrotus purpuratus]AAF14818.1 tektin A1 [Strongylocentrotus purpuratus]|eukprot:XP_001177492.1 PREDICTED: tektin-4 isoform X5 [Strongylocentrotus purpuratus]
MDAGATLLSRSYAPTIPVYPTQTTVGTKTDQALSQDLAKMSGLGETGVYGVPTGAPAAQGFRSGKHTTQEWHESNYNKYFQSFTDRDNAERLCHESKQLSNETHALTMRTQADVTKKLGDRMNDINFWKFELNREIEEMIEETDLLCAQKKRLENALDATEVPLKIARDNLTCRSRRQDIDLVGDRVEMALNKEVDIITKVQDLLKRTLEQSDRQIKLNRGSKHKLTMDWSDKLSAFKIDEKCTGLNNNSTEIQYKEGSAKFEAVQTNPQSWAEFSHDNVVRAEHERLASQQLRNLIDQILTDTSNDMREQCNTVNTEFARRIEEMNDAKTKMENHLLKTVEDIAGMEKNIKDLTQAVKDKEAPMKVAQTRLDHRTHRPNVELCRDPAQYRMVQEVGEIQDSIDKLQQKLAESKASLKDLMDTRMALEKEIALKKNSIFVDRDKCLKFRTRYPSTSKLVGYQ